MKVNVTLHLDVSEHQVAELQGLLRFATQSSQPGRCAFIEPLHSLLTQMNINSGESEFNAQIDCGNAETSNDKLQVRMDTTINWSTKNPKLLVREVGLISDNPNLYKVGDGVHNWNDLPTYGFNQNMITEYNISDHHVNTYCEDTEERYNTNIFTLAEAIEALPEVFHRGGIKIIFYSTNSIYETYILQSTTWSTDVSNWENLNKVIFDGNDSNADLDIADEQGNVLVRFAGGDIQTKNFNSGQ